MCINSVYNWAHNRISACFRPHDSGLYLAENSTRQSIEANLLQSAGVPPLFFEEDYIAIALITVHAAAISSCYAAALCNLLNKSTGLQY